MANNAVKWEGATSRTTGISSTTIAGSTSTTGTSIANNTNKDRFASIQLATQFATAPTDGSAVELYLLYSLDGTNYESGLRKRPPDAIFTVNNQTSVQRLTKINIPLAPFAFKPFVYNAADQQATNATVLLYTHNEEIE